MYKYRSLDLYLIITFCICVFLFIGVHIYFIFINPKFLLDFYFPSISGDKEIRIDKKYYSKIQELDIIESE